MDIDALLKKYGVTYDDMSNEELETFNQIIASVQQGQLTVEKVRNFIASLRYTVSIALAKHDLTSDHDKFLKARLMDLMLIEAFLTSPERAKEHLEKMIANVAGAVG